MNRKIGVVILALVAVLSLSLFACNTTKPTTTKAEALQKYVFSYDDKVVKEDFTLPRRIGDYRATWTSDSEYVVLTKRADDYLATVTIPENDTEANLTVDLYGASDTYKVRLQAITVQDFIDNYSFAQDKGVVYQNFALDTEATYKGKTATIEWSVEDTAYIDVVGNECVVNPSSLNPSVTIYATFTYKGVSAKTFYNFTVSETMEHLQEVNYWYTNTGVSVTMKGYVVEIATAWSSKYENVSLYMVDENLDAGYYLYRVGCDATNAAKLVPGVYLTVEGTTNTLYNGGLYETNADGDITSVDETKTIDLSTTYYALDNDVLAGTPAATYNQSRLVSLSNWTVDTVTETVAEGENVTLFKLKKGEKKVSVAVSKYMEGAYSAYKTDATYAAIIAKYQTIKVGDVVSVKGLLGYYNGAQILLMSADDIVVGGEVGENDTVDADAVAKAMKATDTLFDLDAVITKETKVTLTEAIEGVTVSYRLLGTRTAFSIVDGDLLIVPGAAEIATVQVTYTHGDYTANKFYTMRAEDLDDQGKADWEIENFEDIESIVKEGECDLPDVKFFKAEADGAAKVVWTTDAPYASVKGTVLTVAGLPLEAGTIKLTATVTVGDKTSTRDFYVDVAAYNATTLTYVESEEDLAAGEYAALAMYQANLGKVYYIQPETAQTYYVASTDDVTKAAKVVLEEIEGGYAMKLVLIEKGTNGKEDKTTAKYVTIKVSGTHYNLVLSDDRPTEPWVWNDTAKTLAVKFVTGEGENQKTVYYVPGNYGTYYSFSTQTSTAKDGYFGKLVTGTRTATAQELLDSIKLESTVTEDFALDYKASWEVIDGTGIEIDGFTAKVTQGTAAQTVTLEATLTYGGETVTKEYTITIPSIIIDWKTVSWACEETAKLDASTKEKSENAYYVYGTVIDEPTADYCNFNISDGTKTIKVYGLYTADGTQGYGSSKQIAELPIKKGDVVYLYTKLQNYYGTLELVSAWLQPAPKAGSCEAAPMTPAEAIEIAKALAGEETAYADGKYYITGVVVDTPTSDYCNFNFANAADEKIVVYGLYATEGGNRYGTSREIAEIPFGQGYTVCVVGEICNYVKKSGAHVIEIMNAVLVSYTAPATTGGETGGGETTGETLAIDFTTTAARTKFEAKQQVWESNGVKLVNDQGASTTPCTNHTGTGEVRLYKSSDLTLSCGTKKIKKIVLTYTKAKDVYDGGFTTAENVVVDTSKMTITITFTEAVESWTYTLSAKQLRLTKLTVEVV